MSLNSKKSWNPSNALNKAKVQKKEEDEVERRKKAERRRREIDEEQRQESAAPADAERNKLAWMYSDGKPQRSMMSAKASPADPQTALLLGRTKIDEKMLEERKSQAKDAREAARKLATDPMAAYLAQKRAAGQKQASQDPAASQAGRVSKKSKKHW